MTRNPIHESADRDLSEYLQYWFDELHIGYGRYYTSMEYYLEDSIDRVCRNRSLEVEFDDSAERAEAAQDGSRPELAKVDPNEERDEYVWETYGELTPAQVLEVLDDHGFPVNTHGFSADGERPRLPG